MELQQQELVAEVEVLYLEHPQAVLEVVVVEQDVEVLEQQEQLPPEDVAGRARAERGDTAFLSDGAGVGLCCRREQ